MTRHFCSAITYLFLTLFALTNIIGCVPLLVGTAVGAGGLAYVRGSLEQNFDKSLKNLHTGSLRGLKDIKCTVHSDEFRQRLAKIKFTFTDGKDGTIAIEALTERSAKLKIRIGILGDETKSRVVLNAILRHL